MVLSAQLFTAACGSRATTGRTPVPSEPVAPSAGSGAAVCALIAEPGEPIAAVGLGERVDPANAPHPSNESERLLFRQLYESLVSIDCHGRIAPGLASSWRPGGEERAWVLTLREDARFADRTPVTAADVVASWSLDGGTELGPRASRLVESAVPLDDRTLSVTLRRGGADAPLALAHTDLAIARPAPDAPWPLGTRSARVISASQADDPRPSDLVLERDGRPPVRFIAAAGDPRDLLDEGVDLIVTRDPSALEYADTLALFHSVPLAWRRTYVLLTPGGGHTPIVVTDDMRQALAHDAVRGEARGAQGPFWWQMPRDCGPPHAPPREASAPAPRIVYDAGDDTARELAGRLVALSAYERAAGAAGEALARARRSGADAGYIVALDSRSIDPCRDLQVLGERMPWIDPGAIVPLVETRLHAIVRRGRSGVRAEWDGGLQLASGDER